jgi:hypothetical protein
VAGPDGGRSSLPSSRRPAVLEFGDGEWSGAGFRVTSPLRLGLKTGLSGDSPRHTGRPRRRRDGVRSRGAGGDEMPMRNGELERKYLRLGAGAVRGGGVHGVHAFKAGGDRVVGRRRKWAPDEQCRRSERGRRALARGNLAGLGTRAWARLTEHGTVGTGSLGRGRVSLACTTP